MLPYVLFFLSIGLVCATLIILIKDRKERRFRGIACVCAVLSVVSFIGIGPAYLYSMTPEERAAYEESIAEEESRREESRRAEESRKEESRLAEESRRAEEESRREESRKEEESRQAEIDNCKHTWDSGKITTQSTCEKDGVRTYTCSKCNITKTETIKATGHTYTEVDRTIDLEDRKATVKSKCYCGKTKTEKIDMSVTDIAKYLKENCKTYDYKDIARYPDKHDGELTTFTGEVLQVHQEGKETILLVQITKVETEYQTYYTDSIYVTYKFTDGLKVLEDDIIVMYGESTGEYTYTSIFGQTITVPSYIAYYAELIE